MKRILMSVLLGLSLTGCGIAEQLGRDCGGDLKEGCYNLFGGRNDVRSDLSNDTQNSEIDNLKKRVFLLESQMASSQSQLTVLQDSFFSGETSLQSQVNSINSSLTELVSMDQYHQSQIDSINESITSVQSEISNLQTQDGNHDDQIAQLNNDLVTLNSTLQTQITDGDSNLQSQVSSLNALISQAISDASLLEGRVTAVEGVQTNLSLTVSSLAYDLANTNATVTGYANLGVVAYAHIQGQISTLTNANNDVVSNLASLQASYNSALTQLAALNGYTHIVSIKDPCGAQGSWNEVFLKLSNGTYISSFSENKNGKNTRFVVLTDGTYVTTDDTNCQFTISNGGTTFSNEHN